MKVLRIFRKILAVGLFFSLFVSAVLLAKEVFFDQDKEAASRYYCVNDIEESNKKNVTEISFQNGEDGFHIELCSQDCFANFYKAEPGDAMSTKTEVTNLYETPISVIMKAKSQNKQPADAEIALMSRYTNIKVRNETGLTLYSGKVWNENGEPQNICLGTYGTDESRTLSVDIEISEEAGGNVTEACKNIVWVFTGLNAEATVAAPKFNMMTAKTFLFISIVIICIIVILSVILAQRKRKSARS